MDIEQLERIAFATNRAQALDSLIPGTEDFYFHHCLHHQHQGELDRVDGLLEAWIARHGRTGRVEDIERRQALLRYDRDPQAALDHVRHALGLRFDHQRQVEQQSYDYPTALGQRLDDRHALAGRAMRQASDLSGFTDRALEWLIGDAGLRNQLDAKRRRHLLERVQRPDIPGLLDLVLADLVEQHTGGFGTLRIHGLLLPEQLTALARKQPSLVDDPRFVSIRLRQTRPAADIDWRGDRARYRAYLDALWQLVEPLSPSFNSLKALVLYHRLDLDRRLGEHDRERFLTYLRLPRRGSYTPEERSRQFDHRHLVMLGSDHRGDTGLDVVTSDDDLVRDYLMHFLVDDPHTTHFDGLIRQDMLRQVFIEAKLLGGVGDRERWYALLDDPGRYQALHDRVDIEFAAHNPDHLGAGDAVSLDVYIKNVATLVVKVFEINIRNYFMANRRDIDTSVDLDGLIASHEATYRYQDAPERRVLRTFSFAELDRPGVYVIELVGAGKSSRALVRKGGLRFVERLSAAGHVFTIMDEHNQPLSDATLLLGEREYTPRDDGTIVVPYSTRPRRETVLLCHGDLAVVDSFDHKAESYALWVGFHVEREQLLGRNKAEVIIRPVLRLNGEPMPVSLLEQVTLHIESTDLHDTRSYAETALALGDARECVHTFQVPPDVTEITFTLRARVRSVSEQRDVELSAHRSVGLNQIDLTAHTHDLRLAHTAAGHALHVLGKSGEVRAGQPVNVAFHHRDFTHSIDITLQTDSDGRIDMGPLNDIAHVAATTAGGVSRTWALGQDRSACSHTIHALAGDTITVPWMYGDPPGPRQRVSLLETRAGGPHAAGAVYVRDASAHADITGGQVRIRDLEPGDYDLALLPEGERFTVRVTRGAMQGRWAAGQERLLEIRRRAPMQIGRVHVDDAEIAINLHGATRRARVHVIGTRFVGEHALDTSLGGVHVPEPGWVEIARTESQYISGRDIGDEYRYILDRRQADIFPGNMLERPSLLLNPWSIRTTSTDLQRAAEGEAYASKGAQRARRAAPAAARPAPQPVQQGGSGNLEFLTHTAVVRANLQPDDHGVIRLERDDFAHVHSLQVLAVDDHGSVLRHVALPALPHQHRDLRLHDSLPGHGHFGEKKQITVLGAGGTLVIEDIKTAAVEIYDSLARVHRLFMALTNDATLAEFAFVLDWPGLDQAEKQARYSKYACHELNLLLQRKDPVFFDQVIQPYLANKLHKTFMDHYLIGADLHGYLRPWPYGRLNVVERILLGRRIAGRRGPIARHLRELYELLPVDVDRDNHLFQTALEGSALATEDALGFAEAQSAQREEMKKSMDMPSMVTRAGMVAGFGAPPPMPGRPPAMPKAMAAPAPAPAMMARTMMAADELVAEAWDDEAADLDMAAKELDLRTRDDARRLYRALDKTQEWAENNYYRRRMSEQTGELVQINAFWRDFAEHGDDDGLFVSRHVAHATSSFTEMMLALAVLDLPFEPGKHQVAYAGARMELGAASAAIAFHKEIKSVEPGDSDVPILVNQNYFRLDDRHEYVGNEVRDKYVHGELLVHVVYLCQVILTNPTSSWQKLDLLVQIPGGSMPVNNGFSTRSMHVTLGPNGTHAVEYAFYFPAPGQYPHYPVQVTRNEALIAAAEPTTVTVVERLSTVDTGSWAYISQHGDDQQVLDHLEAHNVARLDLGLIAWRMREPAFYGRVMELLEGIHTYHPVLWSYSVLHRDAARMADYLAHQDWFVQPLGGFFESSLVAVDPVARVWYEHLEYAPLVNARAHRLGARARILNDALAHQYRELLRQLVYQPAPSPDQRLAAAYYLFVQDRVAEALDMFDSVDAAGVTTGLQYDYVRVFAALYRDQVAEARRIAEGHAEHPVDRWRKRFQAALAIIQEAEQAGQAGRIAGHVTDQDDRDQVQARLAATQASFDFSIDNREITVTYQNLDQCRVSYYPMDIELLFSRQPFMQQQAERFSIIKPHRSEVISLPAGGQHSVALPGDYHSANIIVEISAAGRSAAQAYYSNELQVQLADQYGQVRVHHRTTRRPLPRTYVKVYARKQGGEVVFYKDGYTDLRGCFDYTTLSTSELDHVDRFAILIASADHGALIREAAPPKR